MACGTGFCAGKLIGGLVLAGALGYAGYNYATDGCPLGTCGTTEKTAEIQTSFQQLVAEQEDTGLPSCCTADKAEQIVEAASTTEAAACEGGVCPMTGQPVAADQDCSQCPHAGNCDGGACPAQESCPAQAENDDIAATEAQDNSDG